MNEYDSGKVEQILAPVGYSKTEEIREADLILINTCSIREKAEQKVYSLLGRLKPLKERNPSLLIGVGGCVAQQEGSRLLERAEFLDFVFGTHALFDLPEIIGDLSSGSGSRCFTDFTYRFDRPEWEKVKPPNKKITALVTIMRGCNNFCTFCVVPHVRGREMSRTLAAILGEIESAIQTGTREVTLLGQNVNSYQSPDGDEGFVTLLGALNRLEGLDRIRFTTSHPKDLSPELIECFGRLEKLCPHIHLPLQSGSDSVLKRMNRKYTFAQYLAKVQDLRRILPDISITTDLIVGFPGETEEDFQQTLEAMRQIRYDGAFSFKYSDRYPAKASGFSGKIAESEKARRLTALQALQNEITLERNRRFEGRMEQILVESRSKKHRFQMSGRTGGNQVVNFQGSDSLIGTMVPILIEEGLLHSLRGRPATPASGGNAPWH